MRSERKKMSENEFKGGFDPPTSCMRKRPVASWMQMSHSVRCFSEQNPQSAIAAWKKTKHMTEARIYQALTRIFTSPSWGSGIAFLVTRSLLSPPNPASITARISLPPPGASTLPASLAEFLSIMHSVSSVISAPSLAMTETSCSASRGVMWREALMQTGAAALPQANSVCAYPSPKKSKLKFQKKETILLHKSQRLKPSSIAFFKNRGKYLIPLITFSCLGIKCATCRWKTQKLPNSWKWMTRLNPQMSLLCSCKCVL